MPIAYPVTNQLTKVFLSEEELTSLFYHDIFEYPLTMGELIHWSAGKKILSSESLEVNAGNGHFYLKGREGLILKRLMRKRISARKLEIAKEAVKVISLIPSVKMIAVTGALAMENASDEADIDLMIITKKETLWTSRLLVYGLLKVFRFGLRKPKDKEQKDKLCLNMWLSDNDLSWHSKRRNIYSAHEIAQIKPLLNRDSTYERFVSKNNWIQKYWPNAVRIVEFGKTRKEKSVFLMTKLVEKLAFFVQYQYMKKKITREVITSTRALFHPVDWSKFVLQKLSS